MSEETKLPEEDMLKRCEVADLCGLSRYGLWCWVKTGKIPPPVRFGSSQFSEIKWRRQDFARGVEADCPSLHPARASEIKERIAVKEAKAHSSNPQTKEVSDV